MLINCSFASQSGKFIVRYFILKNMNKIENSDNKTEAVIGLDLGTVKLAWIITDIKGKVIEKGNLRHNGNPENILNLFKEFKKKFDDKYTFLEIAATGAMANLLASPIKIIPEQAAQENASKLLYESTNSFNILRLGGNGFSILTYENNKFSYYVNDKCSSGTGTAIERLCQGRFNLSVADACALASKAKNPPKIAARCSVFIKSEITHLANQGAPKEEILASYFNSIASNIWGLAKRKRVPGKFIIIGGVSKNEQIINRLKKLINDDNISLGNNAANCDIEVSSENENFEALGAVQIALELAKMNTYKEIDLERIVSSRKSEIFVLEPLHSYAHKVKKYEQSELSEKINLDNAKVILGLDLGSTGSKLALLDKDTQKIIYDDYLPTKGNPIGAAQELIKKIPEKFFKKIISVGVTGSGRYTAATLLQAAFPELSERVIVKTEIIAHARSACNFDPDKGKSLSVIEIGGQDAKYTLIRNGEIEDSIMNMACAAGTGSFLEEQSILYNIRNLEEFGKLAYSAERPANLGQHCTVFVAELANKALQEKFGMDDIFAGFYYSVVYNYVNRVMGKRIFGEKIFLQGKPASHLALSCAFAAVTEKDIIVPPNPGAMGAIGIAICALEEIKRLNLEDKFSPLEKFLEVKIKNKSEFQCENPKCGNLCRINSTLIEVDGEERRVLSGGMCPKYEQSKHHKLPLEAPNPFKERERLVKSLITEPASNSHKDDVRKKIVGIPVGLGLVRYLPFIAVFFRELGLNVKIIETDKDTIEKGDGLCSSYDTCAPIKIMHGLFDYDIDFYFCPKITALPLIKSEAGSCTCPLVQGVSDLIKLAVKDDKVKFLKPILDLSKGLDDANVRKRFDEIADNTETKFLAENAFNKALKTQKKFESSLLEIGNNALEYAAKNEIPVILVCGRLYTIHNSILNSEIPQGIQESGAIALPVDCYPVKGHISSLEIMYWGEGQRNLRAILDSFERNHIFPVWISNYICGPDSFLEHFFKNLCQEGYPHMNLETDGHSGTAGFVTRIEAFLYTCRLHMKSDPQNHQPNISYYHFFYKGTKSPDLKKKNVKLIIPPMGDGNEFLAAVYRSYGINAIALSSVDRETFMLGRKDCSGKECLPFLCLWGGIKKFLLKYNYEQNSNLVFFVPTTNGPCRFCMYHIRIKQLVDELMKNEKKNMKIEFYSPSTEGAYEIGLGNLFQVKLWVALITPDFLKDMLHYTRPIAKNPQESLGVYNFYKKEIISALEKENSNFGVLKLWGVSSLLEDAAKAFNNLKLDQAKKNRVLNIAMSGEIYVREEIFANDDLVNKLEAYGMRIKLAPYREWINYVSFCERINNRSKINFELWVQKFFEKKLYKICADILGWKDDHKIEEVMQTGYPYLGDAPQGEAILTIGAPILMHKKKEIKGTVIIGPYGCMPTKIAEAQLNRNNDVSFLPIFVDGEPIDENKLANFAWQIGGINFLQE